MDKNGVEVILFSSICWLNEKHIEEQLCQTNLGVITRRYHPNYREHRYELVDNQKKQPNRINLHGGIGTGIIKDCRIAEACNLKKRLGFKLHDVFKTKQRTVVGSIKDAFEGENMQAQ